MSRLNQPYSTENSRPLVIRIDDVGRAEAINYHNLEYKPQDAEAKYFLSQFCAVYYRRNRYTIQDDFSKSLYFLDAKLADGILDAYRKDGGKRQGRPAHTTACKTTRDQRTLHQGIRSGRLGRDEEHGSVFGHAERLFSNCSASELSKCGKLLKARRGEVAERLNAAVC